MSDLLGGPAGVGRAHNGATRGGAGPVPVPQAPASGVRTPTEIMRNRQAREAARAERRKEEDMQEAERTRRFQEEERRKSAERRAQAAGVSTAAPQRDSGYRSATVTQSGFTPAGESYRSPAMGQLPSVPATSQPAESVPAFSKHDPAATPTTSSATHAKPGYAPIDPTAPSRQAAQAAKPRGSSLSQDHPRPVQPQAAPGRSITQPQAQSSSKAAATDGPTPSTSIPGGNIARDDSTSQRPTDPNKSSFPHAFERWETLSSHFEGLTSYWIRRMEQNNDDIRRDPISQQMSRQITDLSAAGANLFHAVVELQRLRASSERKFQRWFFETRADQERARENLAQLQSALEAERSARNEEAQAYQQTSMVANDRQLQDLKRELQICKDEARRAWEELGQREQLDRERVFKLRDGYAVDILGIQVVPQQMMSRDTSMARPPTQGAYPAPSVNPALQTQDLPPAQHFTEEASPIETDPFSGSEPPPVQPIRAATTAGPHDPFHTSSTATRLASSGAQAGQPQLVSTGNPGNFSSDPDRYYRAAHASDPATAPSRQTPAAMSEGESDDGFAIDDRGNVIHDERGNPIPFRSLAALQQQRIDHPSPIAEELATDVIREQQRVATYGRSDSSDAVPLRGPGQSGRPSRSELDRHVQAGQAGYNDENYREDLEGDAFAEDEVANTAGDWEEAHAGAARHHHPTRLSDVLEEDERSGGGASGRDSQIF